MLNKKNHCALKELPNCHGPKLHRFRYWNAPIEWSEQLDEIRATEPHSDGSVFRVKIRSQFYAIKVVSIARRKECMIVSEIHQVIIRAEVPIL